ncbi:MAG: NADP-specific glutamate dehydrogenase [Streptococcaceae bacterium]|jgi:glutamate dehydrogenase (NADP+)|nr:NADP-specific glutamate dehydrogenase [Streptococcaceae bacterium]
MNSQTYIEQSLTKIKSQNSHEPEFIQAVEEVFHSLAPVLEKRQDLIDANILERMAEPERIIIFKVSWIDDAGAIQVNRGFRVQFNSAIGPYKGGLRFASTVNLSTVKFLAFEQTFKNALTSLPIGGGKGGSDFDPQGKSDREIMRFCQAFMLELSKHIGGNVDSPAGDIGVGSRELGYLFGYYKRIKNEFDGAGVTGKPVAFSGSILRPEATGYGLAYFAEELLEDNGDSLSGKTIIASGYGNVCWGLCKKATELGAKVVTLSSRIGYVYDPDGVNTEEKFNFMLRIRNERTATLKDYAVKFGAEFFPNEKPWSRAGDLVIPCATQNEIGMVEAQLIADNGVKAVIEGSNMSTTNDALSYFKMQGLAVAPAKAANAGGVAVSALEMSQNAMKYPWTAEEVDDKLQNIMKNIYHTAKENAQNYGLGEDLVAGANIAGFLKVAEAMILQGEY